MPNPTPNLVTLRHRRQKLLDIDGLAAHMEKKYSMAPCTKPCVQKRWWRHCPSCNWHYHTGLDTDNPCPCTKRIDDWK